MKCLKCGYEFSEGLFCPECGTKYDEEEAKKIEEKRIKEEQEEKEREEEKNRAYQAKIEKEKIEQEVELVKQKNENMRLQHEEEDRKSRTVNGIVYNTLEEAETARKTFEEKEKEKDDKKKRYTNLSVWSLVLSILSLPLICTVVLWIPASIVSIILGIKALKEHTQYKARIIVSFILNGIAILLGILWLFSFILGIISPELVKYIEKTEQNQQIQQNESEEQNTSENIEEINEIEQQEQKEDINIDNSEDSIFTESYKAYYNYLSNNDNLNIFDYDKADKTISFNDCYGDEYPEMLYFYPQKDGEYDINMFGLATFDGSEMKKINSDIGIAPGAAGSPSIRLFVGDSKIIYGIEQYSAGLEYYSEFFVLEEGSDGVLHRNDMYSYVESEDYDTGNSIIEFKKGNTPMSQEDTAKEISEILKNAKKIYQSSYYYDMGDPYKVEEIISEEADMMTYDEAIEYLQKIAPMIEDTNSSSNTETSQDYEVIYQPVIQEYKDAYEAYQNGNYFDEEKYKFLSDGFMDLVYTPKEELGYLIEDISGDGIPELIIGDNSTEGEGYSFIWGGYTYKNGEIVQFLDGWWRNRYFWIANGEFYNAGSGGWSESCIIHLTISEDGTSLMIDDYYFSTENSYGEVSYYHNSLKNGAVKESEGGGLDNINESESISEEAFQNVTKKYIFEKLNFKSLF